MAQDDEWRKMREYRRTPIQIHNSAVILVRIFTGYDHFTDLWTDDIEHPVDHHDIYDGAAEQFVKQLEGHDCIAFHQALVKACQKRIDEWRETCKRLEAESAADSANGD